MRRKSFLSVRKGMAVALTAAVVMSQSMMVYAKVETSTVTAENDQKIVKDGIEVTSADSATGVQANSTEEHTTSVTVDNGISVTANGNDATALGIYASSSGTNAKTEVTVSSGAVTAKEGSESSTDAKGIYAYGSGGGTVTVSTGEVSASGSKVAQGIFVNNNGSSIVVTTGAVVSNSTSNVGLAYGASISGFSGTTTVNTGSISVDSENCAEGIHASSNASQDNHKTLVNITTGSIQAMGGEETKGVVVSADGSSGTSSLDLTVNGSVNTSGTGVDVSAYKSNVAEITVTQDINAGNTAVLLSSSDQASLKLEVDGTISGKERNIVIDQFSATEGIDITVWKVDTSGGKEVIEQKDDMEYFVPENAAEIVNYIIKVEGNLTPESRTAHENERVTLRVDVPAGYSIENFYTVNGGTNVEVLQDASGQYYLVVPRGGGVYVGVNLRSNGTSGGGSSDDNDNGRSTSSDNSVQNVTVGPKTMMVNGVDQKNDIHVGSASADMNRAFTETLSTFAATGMLDISGQYVSVPENAEIKDSFTFTADNATGFVTAYLEFKNYKEGDIILCSYFDASGNMVTLALTPDQINGTSVILTLPAQCTLALAGSPALVVGPTGGPLV